MEWIHLGKKKFKWKTKPKVYTYSYGKKSKRKKRIRLYGQTIRTGLNPKAHFYYRVNGWGFEEKWVKQSGATLFIKSKIIYYD